MLLDFPLFTEATLNGLKSYESALKDDELPADCKELVRSFLDRTHDHISALDRALAAL